ncbi:MAG: protein translocase subunit SecF [Candidatus Latescibacteria bacterium]|nr:protein translocase subunit SecF [bacterium]MBD3423899.1 protein translocase subunit SecF [Candidatus Latescibacterota bacterium]
MMRFIGETHIKFVDFRNKAFLISLAVILAGLISLAVKGGPDLSIDFEGGTLVQIKFDQPVSINELRSVVENVGFQNNQIQEFGQENEYLIKVEKIDEAGMAAEKLMEALNNVAPEAGWEVVSVRESTEGLTEEGKAGNLIVLSGENIPETEVLVNAVKDQGVGVIAATRESDNTVAFNVPFMGIEAKASEKMKAGIEKAFPDRKIDIRRTETVGPKIGEEMKDRAWAAIIISLFGILVYISWRFEFKFAVGAIIALIHDILITLGIFSITGKELSLVVIAAFLTIVGYSLNDTIVVFDRIRENFSMRRRRSLEKMVNTSINESLSRTIITSLTTLIVVLFLFFAGGEVIHDFAFALLIGVIVGTYSSIFVASPVLIEWQNRISKKKKARS